MGDSGSHVIGDRYVLLGELGRGGMGVVFRAYDRLHQQVVAIKRVNTPDPASTQLQMRQSSTETRVALAHEFQILASLHHPHVIDVLDYGFDAEQQPFFTMDYLEHAQPITRAGRQKPLETQIRLLTEMVQALEYLHRRGIVHRDLKPDNALVTVDGTVKVLDFGLAMLREQRSAEDEVTGTIAYMAPEMFRGGSASEASDLYAVGVIAFEMLAGRHPFDVGNGGQLLQSILLQPADLDLLNVDATFSKIIGRLLEKIPDDRYKTARQLITALSELANEPVPAETLAIRESFLQAAQFVGRDAELEQLTEALSQLLEGHGSTWLVAGESGVGKSRLLGELRTLALVKGTLVLHGQGVAEGGLAYQLWREPLRRLALAVNLGDVEAGIVKQVIPDISALLGREVSSVPPLEGQAGRDRFLDTIADIFRAYRQPIVLILEDLQWTSESLDVLRKLNSMVSEIPLLIIGSYRYDERPGLAEELPGMEVLRLQRLTEEEIAELSVSMLGEVGRNPAVLQLLQKETEGNAFFLVEIVRALAEEAGRLADVSPTTLPAQVFAGGVQQVVQRRLSRVPDHAQPLLTVAATAGRRLDLGLLREIDPRVDLEQWLTACSSVAVLDFVDGRWRFAHDKLRESLLGLLPIDERQRLHMQVAMALESVYRGSLDEYAGMIGDHYEQSEEQGKGAEWHLRAAVHAEETYAPVLAITFYRKALAYWGNRTEHPEKRLALYRGLGKVLNWSAEFAEAAEAFRSMCVVAQEVEDLPAQAFAWQGMATSQLRQGNIQAALECAERGAQIAQSVEAHRELGDLLLVKGWSLFGLGDLEGARTICEENLLISQQWKQESQIAQCLNLRGAVALTTGDYRSAAVDFTQALEICETLGDRVLAMSLVNNLGLIAVYLGDYWTAVARYQEALDRAHEIGNRRGEMEFLSNLGEALVRVEEYEAAEHNLREVIAMAEASGFAQVSESYRFLAEAYLGQGKVSDALLAAEIALSKGREVESPEYVAGAWSVLGQVVAQSGVSVRVKGDEGDYQTYDAVGCFKRSNRLYKEMGMDGERARTMRAWALYELEHGDHDRGQIIWSEARQIFARLGANMEVERMDAVLLSD